MDKIKSIICEYIDTTPDQIDDNMSLSGDIGLDSFGLISMLSSIEEEFHVDIPEYELKNFQTLNDLYAYVVNA